MMSEDEDIVEGLLKVEQEMSEKLVQLHVHHQELRELDYDTDIKQLRPYLDLWMDWHLWASYWLTQAKIARWQAKQEFQEAWQRAHTNVREIEMAATVSHYSSQPERQVYYEIRTRKQRFALDLLDRLVDVTYAFLAELKTVLEHWDKRRVDTKWELDRMSRLPGSDYR